jgi:hypothetical protein
VKYKAKEGQHGGEKEEKDVEHTKKRKKQWQGKRMRKWMHEGTTGINAEEKPGYTEETQKNKKRKIIPPVFIKPSHHVRLS